MDRFGRIPGSACYQAAWFGFHPWRSAYDRSSPIGEGVGHSRSPNEEEPSETRDQGEEESVELKNGRSLWLG